MASTSTTLLEYIQHDQGQQQGGEAHQDVGKAHDAIADPAIAIARNQAKRHADDKGTQYRRGRDDDRVLCADDHARENRAA
jgi:hypothetical protein